MNNLSSPFAHQAWAFVRQIIPPLVMFALGRHWIPDDVLPLVVAIGAGVGVPITIGQFKTRALAQAAANQE